MIDKLNNVQFTKKTGKADCNHKHKQDCPAPQDNQQKIVISKDGAKALRNYAMGILAALGTSIAVPTLTSCEKIYPDIDMDHSDSLKVNVDYHPVPQKPDTFIITKDSIVRDTIWETDSIPYPVYLPGDTIRDTIKIEIPGENVYIKPNYESEVADSLIAHAKNLGLEVDGGGKIPTRIHAFDQWNSTDHDILFDGKASSYETMVFVDRMKDYSKDSKNPTLKYGKCEYSVDYGKGVTFEYYKSRYEGAKPDSKNDWIPAGKVCLTNLRNGFIQKSTYDENGGLVKKGTYEKGDSNISFYENLIAPSGYEDSYAWSEGKMYTSNPEK